METETHCGIAREIVDRLGGHERMAALLDVSITQIYRFTYPKDKNGTGGLIPAKHIPKLVGLEDKDGKHIEYSDFFEKRHNMESKR